VVRAHGETGSSQEPKWAPEVDALARKLENAITETTAHSTLSDLIDSFED
jgi:hypothetical protein